ncbi:MAG: fibronectin type III domain-containing protein, partial [Phycisphaerae bacterium]
MIAASALTMSPRCAAAGDTDNTLVNLPQFKKANSATHPFMGWSSWSLIRGAVDAKIVKAQARVMAARLKQFGYNYINIDAGW